MYDKYYFTKIQQMDLALTITESAAEIFRKECLTNTCYVNIIIHNRYKYNIIFVPMAKHIIIKYKTLEYKISREDNLSYKNIIDFLIEAIDDDADTSLQLDIEYDYWPDHDENFYINSLIIKRHNNNIFNLNFKRDKFKDVMQLYLKCMINLN